MPTEREEQRRKATELNRVIKLALPDNQYQLVCDLSQLDEDLAHSGRDEEVNHLIDAIARHFPGLEPAIRAVASHFTESNNDLTHDECGLGRRPAPDYMTGGCAPDTGEAERAEQPAAAGPSASAA